MAAHFFSIKKCLHIYFYQKMTAQFLFTKRCFRFLITNTIIFKSFKIIFKTFFSTNRLVHFSPKDGSTILFLPKNISTIFTKIMFNIFVLHRTDSHNKIESSFPANFPGIKATFPFLFETPKQSRR